MSNSQQTTLPQVYKHQKDTRTQTSISLSNKIVNILSQLNLNRFRARHQNNPNQSYQNKYFFICLTGLPPFDQQFQNLQLPGQKIIYTPKQFLENFTEKQYEEMFYSFSIQKCCDQLNMMINKIDPKNKIVLLFHSFGGYITTTYIHKYGIAKISGYIDIGGIPITFYQILRNLVKKSLPFDHDNLLQNASFIQQQYRKNSSNSPTIPLSNKYHLINFMKFATMDYLHNMFQWARNCDGIVKLIMHGRKDALFTENLLNEKIIHYCYSKKMNPEYEKLLKQQYKRMYGVEVNNIQQRFVISFQDAKHSLHMQQKFVKDINMAIKQYLKLIDIV